MFAQDEPRRTLAVGVVVVDGGGRVLLVRRAHPPSEGAWTLPGGHVEPGEPLEAAALRELREETSLRARIVCALGPVAIDREGRAFEIHEFLAAPLGPTDPRAGDDAADARWVERHELDALGVHPEAIAVIDRALAEAGARSPA
ncbi:MAG TPA: NUDIX domain-containing protein [Polyangiaceae bacterium]|nr:NUDIX domain-containing protein [Polyangiaceae bacterium]